MKKLLLSLVVMLLAVGVMAQHREGTFTVQPKVGMNISSLTDADKTIVALNFGMESEYMVTDNFSFAAGLHLSNQGAKYDDGTTKYTADLDYVNVPIVANVYVLPGLAVKAGVQLGYRTNAKIKTDDGTMDMDAYYKLAGFVLGEDYKISKFDLSIPVGISYEYNNIVLDARYNWGLIKVENYGDPYYNRVFQLTLGYKFELDF